MRKIIFLALFLAILVRIPFLSREFVLEEAFHARAAQTVAESGYPLAYYGEQQPPAIYLDRPPGLLFLVAASFKLFGQSEMSARIVPMTFFLATLLTIFYFGIRLFPNQKTAVLLAILILQIHPFMIQNSLMIHHDGALVLFFVTVYLFLTFEKIIKKQNSWRDHAHLGIILFFSLWIKYEPIIFNIILATGLTFFIYRPFLKKYFVSSAIAIGLYFLIFYFYNLNYNHPEGFLLPLKRTLQLSQYSYLPKITSFNWFDHALQTWSGSYYIAIRFLSWLSIPTILLAAYSFVKIAQIRNLRKNPKIIFLFSWFLLISSTYIFVGWAGDYPRYFSPAIVPFTLLIGIAVQKSFEKSKINLQQLTVISTTSLLVTLFFKAKGYLFLDRITGWIPNLQISFFAIIALVIFVILLLRKHQKLSLSLFVFLLFFQFFQILAQYRHDVNIKYSLTNFYGNGPYKPVAEFLKQKLHPEDKILTFDPVGYYWGGQYYDYYEVGSHRPENYINIIEAFKKNKISAIALPKDYFGDLILKGKENNFEVEQYVNNKYEFRNIDLYNGIYLWY